VALACGLGNPEPRYANTPHNAGFWVLDRLAQNHRATWNNASRFQALTTKISWPGQPQTTDAHLLKPLTYMNLSGRALALYSRFHKIPPEQCLIIVDDISLPLGTLRLRQDGGHGGHNGLRSIQEHLGTTHYPRLRFGIAPDPRPPAEELSAYVLRPLPDPVLSALQDTITSASALVEEFLKNGFGAASALYSRCQTLRAKSQKKPTAEN
jgi:PTH1 family peptidyl-tRNA hydrolase